VTTTRAGAAGAKVTDAIGSPERVRLKGDKPLASALHSGRLAKGRTLRDIGAAAGVDFTMLCRFEKGEILPGQRALKKLATALGLPYAMLAELAIGQALSKQRTTLRKRYGVTD
jgi:transcriptional regulator with XRE-family HTH domain